MATPDQCLLVGFDGGGPVVRPGALNVESPQVRLQRGFMYENMKIDSE